MENRARRANARVEHLRGVGGIELREAEHYLEQKKGSVGRCHLMGGGVVTNSVSLRGEGFLDQAASAP